MEERTDTNTKKFETDHWYAIFSGLLIIPAIVTLFGLLGALIMVIYVNPTQLSGFDLVIYFADVIYLPLLIILYFTWFKRKKIMPKLIIVYFALTIVMNLLYSIFGFGIDVLNLAMSTIWIVYFIRSKRVKETFIN
ncbi:DUF2569 domain-containing protein [Pseudogracilibacillus sp. SE30717A]|uniref:DUF2569 domain-containing protein n=1 Tax=Pseudogracilibacillus sp. SE30717A TaxID=3098293 RepID=UPI00300E2A73